MPDWRQVAKALALANGHIDERITFVLRCELFGDGKLDRSELEFLLDLRRSAPSADRCFHQLLFQALKPVILADGVVTDKEAEWLRRFIFADGRVWEDEKQFLRDLKAGAQSVSPEFEALCRECLGDEEYSS
jgi:hypothetical protein